MVVNVRLEGLNIVKARGRWYVYFRDGGALLKGFEGTRDELGARLGDPDMLGVYNGRRSRDLSRVYPEGSLGSLVAWFKNDCPRWEKLSDATRKDYDAAYEWLRPEWDCPLDTITTPGLYEVRDRCAKEKWPRFADKMISALSSMFTQGVKRNKLLANPCLGMDKAHAADPNANREWSPDEQAIIATAPQEIRTPLMLARYAGLRGQSIVVVNWKQRSPHPLTGSAIRLVTRKNNEPNFLPELQQLQDYLADIKVRTPDGPIALRDDGTPWASEKDMQTRVSHWLRDREREGMIGAGTTLHGLRVSYAAWWKRTGGASDGEVADLLGDKSERMGKHYTRHVEREVNVIRAFERVKDKK
jgi:integrase